MSTVNWASKLFSFYFRNELVTIKYSYFEDEQKKKKYRKQTEVNTREQVLHKVILK